MNPFNLHRASNVNEAVSEVAKFATAKFIGGGTNLIDLMKENVERPTLLLDINHLNLKEIARTPDGGLAIGALVTNANLAYHKEVLTDYPLLSEAILAGASAQLRNMATTGGNLLQRTRCYYFYDAATACNKREPGTGCSALQGFNRIHAIFGASESCIAVHPSDMCVALAALEATIAVKGPRGERSIPIADFHRLPGNKPEQDTILARDEMILSVNLPAKKLNRHFTYLKVRDRASYAFALVSAAVALEMKDGLIAEAKIAMGGLAHKPWRVPAAEAALKNQKPSGELFKHASELFFEGAQTFEHNSFKPALGRRALARALDEAISKGSQR